MFLVNTHACLTNMLSERVTFDMFNIQGDIDNI